MGQNRNKREKNLCWRELHVKLTVPPSVTGDAVPHQFNAALTALCVAGTQIAGDAEVAQLAALFKPSGRVCLFPPLLLPDWKNRLGCVFFRFSFK